MVGCAEGKIWQHYSSNYFRRKYKVQNSGIELVELINFCLKIGLSVFEFASHIKFDVGNMLSTSFWNAIWNENNSMKTKFPYLYLLSHRKDETIEGWVVGPTKVGSGGF